VAAALEVLVELAAHGVQGGRGLHHARRQPLCHLLEHRVVGLAREGHAHQPGRRGGHEQRPDRRVEGRVGHVEQALGGGPLREALGDPVGQQVVHGT
jgi:hypothetical protein